MAVLSSAVQSCYGKLKADPCGEIMRHIREELFWDSICHCVVNFTATGIAMTLSSCAIKKPTPKRSIIPPSVVQFRTDTVQCHALVDLLVCIVYSWHTWWGGHATTLTPRLKLKHIFFDQKKDGFGGSRKTCFVERISCIAFFRIAPSKNVGAQLPLLSECRHF